jgi:hypothetical protein
LKKLLLLFLVSIAAPARRALATAGITNPHQISTRTENELLKLQGVSPSTIPKLKTALKVHGLSL